MLSLTTSLTALSSGRPVVTTPRAACTMRADSSRRDALVTGSAMLAAATTAVSSASAKSGEFGKIGIFGMSDISSPYQPGGPQSGPDATFGYKKSDGEFLAKGYQKVRRRPRCRRPRAPHRQLTSTPRSPAAASPHRPPSPPPPSPLLPPPQTAAPPPPPPPPPQDVSREKKSFLESSSRISSLQPKIDSKTWWFLRDELRIQARAPPAKLECGCPVPLLPAAAAAAKPLSLAPRSSAPTAAGSGPAVAASP